MRARRSAVILLLVLTCSVFARSQSPSSEEFRARRLALMERLPAGLLILPSRGALPFSVQIFLPTFVQEPNFYYFAGLGDAVPAVLVLDAPRRQSLLFVGPASRQLPGAEAFVLTPGQDTAKRLQLDHVADWGELESFLDRRLAEQPSPEVYLELAPAADSVDRGPLGTPRVSHSALDWQEALGKRWPRLRPRSAADVLTEMRLVKSPAEIAVLRRVGRTSSLAMLAGLRALRDGTPQRHAEVEVARACLLNGAEGPSFWPWVMTGPHADYPAPWRSFGEYRHMDRVMRTGDLARVDVGCDLDFYKGDVGRTGVVGAFSPGQRETWELLVAAYRAGLAAIRDGVTRTQVFAASLKEVERLQPSLKTPLARRAADKLLSPSGTEHWSFHGVGIEAAEGSPATLRSGMVLAFEPIFSVDGQGFYLEDLVLVTDSGHELLTPGLPYTADEIERAIRGAWK